MKSKDLALEQPTDLAPSCDEPDAAIQATSSKRRKAALRADAALVKRCLAGEVAGWEELYSQCHEPLLVSIKIMLGRNSNDANLIDELAARVWYALVANDGELLSHYDAGRGARLCTFMRMLAKDEINRHFRAEIRRHERELEVLRERSQSGSEIGQPAVSLADFMGSLTPHERLFCGEYLIARGPAGEQSGHTNANVWQLTRRVHQKLLKFLGYDS